MAEIKGEQSLVSVIIPTRNRQQLLVKAIRSVIDQTWQNIEVIVIDDASDDGTIQAIKEINSHVNIVLIHNDKPRGGAVARNQGIEKAVGYYVAFLDDDDTWSPDKLAQQISLFEQTPDCAAVTCCYFEQYPDGSSKKINVVEITDEQKMLEGNYLGGASMYLTTKQNLRAINGFDPTLRSGQDWDLLIKLWSAGPIKVCEQPLVNYLAHNSLRISNSYNSSYEGLKRIYFLYKNRMSDKIRYYHLAELLFYRMKLSKESSLLHIPGFYKILKRMNFARAVKFVLRVIRYFLFEQKKSTTSRSTRY